MSQLDNDYSKKAVTNGLHSQEQRMEWLVTVDARKENITELKLIDSYFPEKSMLLLKDTLKVYKTGNDGKRTLVESEKYELRDKSVEGFELEFKGELERAKYEIEYSTSYEPIAIGEAGGVTIEDIRDREFINNVVFKGKQKDSNDNEKTIDTSKNALYELNEDAVKGGRKDGELDREKRVIDWKVYTNSVGHDLKGENFTITYKLGENQELIKESLVLKEYKVIDSTGEFVITENVIDENLYTVKFEKDSFVVDFKEGLDIPVVLEYSSKIIGKSQADYSNKTSIKGKYINHSFEKTVEYPDHDKFIDKKAINSDGDTVYKDDHLEWEIDINESLSELKNVKFTDNISDGHVYLKNSFKLYDKDGKEVKLEDDKLKIEKSKDGSTELSLELGDINGRYTIEYKTIVIGKKDSKISNSAKLEGKDLDDENISNKEFTVNIASWGTGSGVGSKERGNLQLNKIDAETNEKILSPAKFEFYYYINDEETEENKQIVTGEIVETVYGMAKYGNIPYGTYYLREVEAPEGYEKFNKPVKIIINEENKSYEYNFKNSKEKQEIDIEANKIWINGPEEKPSIELQLYRNDIEFEEVITLKNGETSYIWENLDKTDENGKEYEYTVDEVSKPENYGKSISEDGLTITNTFESPKTDIVGIKIWIDGPEEKPSIQIQLYRNGKKYLNPVNLEDGETAHIWKDLDRMDKNGKEYKYTVDEVSFPSRYEKTISADGLTITNEYIRPSRPNRPNRPNKPNDPNRPVVPGEPTNPNDPNRPVVPGEPTNPNDPNRPVVPGEPTNPNDPLAENYEDGNILNLDKEELEESELLNEKNNGLNNYNSDNKLDEKRLPKTGVANNSLYYVIGLLFIGAGTTLFKKKK